MKLVSSLLDSYERQVEAVEGALKEMEDNMNDARYLLVALTHSTSLQGSLAHAIRQHPQSHHSNQPHNFDRFLLVVAVDFASGFLRNESDQRNGDGARSVFHRRLLLSCHDCIELRGVLWVLPLLARTQASTETRRYQSTQVSIFWRTDQMSVLLGIF